MAFVLSNSPRKKDSFREFRVTFVIFKNEFRVTFRKY